MPDHPDPSQDKEAKKRVNYPRIANISKCYPFLVGARNLLISTNLIGREYYYCCTANTIERYSCNSYYNCNNMKCLHKIEEFKEKRDEELQKILHNDPLVSIPIDCRFGFLK